MSLSILPCLLCNDTGMAQVLDNFAPCGRCGYTKADPKEWEKAADLIRKVENERKTVETRGRQG